MGWPCSLAAQKIKQPEGIKLKKLLLTLISFVVLFGTGTVKADDNLILQDAQIIVEDARTVTRLAQAAIYGEQKVAVPGDKVPAAVMGFIKNTGTAAMTTGHGIGVLGYAEDNSSGEIDMYGVEGRVNGSSTHSGIWYRGTLGLSHVEASTFAGNAIGLVGRSEIYNLSSQILYEGTGIGLYIPTVIGGSLQYGIWCEDDVIIKGNTTMEGNLTVEGEIKIYDSTGEDYGTIKKDINDNLVISSDNGSVGFGSDNIVTSGFFTVGQMKMAVTESASQPSIAADGYMQIWINTADNDRVYLLFQRGDSDVVKVELQ